jgi:hypothetical protein
MISGAVTSLRPTALTLCCLSAAHTSHTTAKGEVEGRKEGETWGPSVNGARRWDCNGVAIPLASYLQQKLRFISFSVEYN